jgi:MYXO-CTERM domain-containing protein
MPVVVRRSPRARFALGSSLAIAVALGSSTLVSPRLAHAEGLLLASRVVPAQLSGDAETRARAILLAKEPSLAQVELRFLDAIPVGVNGAFTMVRFTQHVGDLPVIGKGARVMLTRKGQATRLVTADVADDTASLGRAAISAEEAAKNASRYARAGFSAADGRLVAYGMSDGTRLAYLFYRGVIPGTDRSPMVVVDAQNGRRLTQVEAGHHAKQASLYVPNPVTAKAPTPVTLDLPDGAKTLENDSFVAKSCVDKGRVVDAGQGYNIHLCDFETQASADANGDFPYTLPAQQENEDAFAEVSAFYHVTRAYKYLQDRGMPKVAAPFLIGANFRVANGDIFSQSTAKDPLEPYANAFYAPADPSFEFLFNVTKPALFLGQATQIDFAYDGDVVYHEFGHGMVDLTAKLDGEWKLDTQGAFPAPGAMNEGIADTVSSWIAGDPNVGEYGSEEGGGAGVGETAIRSIDNKRRCPDDIVGEEHQDSLYFSGALWATREKAFADATSRKLFEAAVITALSAAPTGNLGMDDYVELLVTALTESQVGDDKIAVLRKEFADRGFAPSCKRVFEWTGTDISSTDADFYNFFFLPGRPYVKSGTTPYAPGIFQVHAKLPANTASVEVAWEQYPYSQGAGFGQNPAEPQVIVRYGAEPITFQAKGSFKSTAEDPVDASGPKFGQGRFSAKLTVPQGQDEAWIMLVNGGDEGALFGQMRLTFTKGAVNGNGGNGGTSAAGGTTGTAGNSVGGTSGTAGGTAAGNAGASAGGNGRGIGAPAAEGQALPHPEGGCSFVAASSSTATGVFALFGLGLGLAFRRRRS